MSNTANSLNESYADPNAGYTSDQNSLGAPSIGLPQPDGKHPTEPHALPVLARIPRLESATPSPSESRQYRIDFSPVQATQPHVEVNPPSITQPISSSIAPDICNLSLEDEHVAIHSAHELPAEEPTNEIATEPLPSTQHDSRQRGTSPLGELRRLESNANKSDLAEFMLRMQLLLKPLARAILLAALLTASALAYLLLEDNQVPLAPVDQEQYSPEFASEPRLTRKPAEKPAKLPTNPKAGTEIAPPLPGGSQLQLQPRRPLSAIGPGGNNPRKVQPIAIVDRSAQKPSLLAKAPASKAISPIGDSISNTDPHTTFEKLGTTLATTKMPSVQQVIPSSNHSPTLSNYPQTSHPMATISPVPVGPSNTTVVPTTQPTEQPPAVARLTGSIQEPIKR